MLSNPVAGTVERPTAFKLDAALKVMVSAGASDLHLTVNSEPKARIRGELVSIGKMRLEPDMLQAALYSALTPEQKVQFEEVQELDFAYEVEGAGRFRVNYYVQKNFVGAVFRHLSTSIRSLEDLNMPAQIARLAELPRGLVLVTGPTGSGKSTTLAAIVDLINRTRAGNIMTIEDPIEYVHEHKKSIINQREVGADTHSFKNALKHVLRQDPDVILIGELRDLETISIALTSAETGHLVLASLHTQDAAQSIDRMIDVFPAEQHAQVRTQLAATLQGVVCQALLPTVDGKGRAVATEVMFLNSAIANMVREQKSEMIYSALQAGRKEGMHSMDQSLADLVKTKQISYETALDVVHDRKAFDLLVDASFRQDAKGSAEHKDWERMSSVDFDSYSAPTN